MSTTKIGSSTHGSKTRETDDVPGISPTAFLGVFGALIAEGRNHRDVFEFFGVDAGVYLAEVGARCDPEDDIVASDVYPDAVSTLATLQAAGHRVVIVGNQPVRAAEETCQATPPTSVTASTTTSCPLSVWGCEACSSVVVCGGTSTHVLSMRPEPIGSSTR